MPDPTQSVLLVVLTALAVAASRHAWRTRQAYGLLRFLGFAFLAALFVTNAGIWFRDPFSVRQIASWTVFVVATVLAAHGILLLRRVGRARSRVMEDTRVVVESGAYRYVRHPLYSALILLGWGIFLKSLALASGILAASATGFLVATARAEERFNLERFGGQYAGYMSRTKMFVPFLF
jgi:protein-S-isoprenylcysteine O-methyltransferase Ste14